MDLQGGPTFEDLSIDDNLSQLERVVRYSGSSIALQRLVHVKMLAETVAVVGFEESVKSIVPLLGPLADDQELVVRQHLGEQLDEIARLCRSTGKEAGYRLIIETILPTLTKLLGDSQAEVRQAAGESLVGVAGLMKPLDLGQHVLTIVLQLAHDDEQEELRMTAAALLNDLAESLGNDLCKQFVTPEMVSLSEDPVFRVRKATALNLHKICKVVGDPGIQRLLPAYIRLTKDDVYRVRKACTEALVDMSKAVGPEMSLRELTPVFLNLATDSSKLVRTGALQHLGRLISTLPGESVTEELVGYFTATAVETMGDPVVDAELRLYCAFSFPAVVITVGSDRWKELRESFSALLRDPSWSVRKTLSHSLHEVAKVLNTEDVETDLVPAMEVFLRDMEDVRIGVIRHLADLFEQMSPPRRERHLNVLVEILQTTSPFNWRLREVLAQQLPKLAPLLTLDSVFFAIVPVAFGLLNDPVAVVRERTFEVVAPLLRLAGAHSSARQASMVARVRELAHAPAYQARQMYVYICHSMTLYGSQENRDLFVKEFVPSLAELARDSVVNVRISMSRTLSKCPDWVMELPEIRRAVHFLVEDANRDVRHFVSFLPPILGQEMSQEDKVLWVDTSSVLSDESVRTQWSVSTQRSMLSVGDFPHVKDATSPNRAFKLGRQRSSSVESAGESGNSTTSSEGEALRLSSRRPPLPAGWGPGAASTASGETSADGNGSVGMKAVDASGGRVVADAPPSGDGVEAWRSGSDADAGVGVGADGGDGDSSSGGGGPSAVGESEAANRNLHLSGGDDMVEADNELGASKKDGGGIPKGIDAAEALPEGDQAVEGKEDGSLVSAAALRAPERSTETAEKESPAAKVGGGGNDGDGDGDGDVVSAIFAVPPVDSVALSSKMEALTLGDDAGIIPEVNREGMLPPTPLPNAVPLAGGLRPSPFDLEIASRNLGKSGGTSAQVGVTPRPFEEHAPMWTGDEDDDDISPDGAGLVADTRRRASVLGDGVAQEAQMGRVDANSSPPPWHAASAEGSDLGSGATAAPPGGLGDYAESSPATAFPQQRLAGDFDGAAGESETGVGDVERGSDQKEDAAVGTREPRKEGGKDVGGVDGIGDAADHVDGKLSPAAIEGVGGGHRDGSAPLAEETEGQTVPVIPVNPADDSTPSVQAGVGVEGDDASGSRREGGMSHPGGRDGSVVSTADAAGAAIGSPAGGMVDGGVNWPWDGAAEDSDLGTASSETKPAPEAEPSFREKGDDPPLT